jgi:hypothetical protein
VGALVSTSGHHPQGRKGEAMEKLLEVSTTKPTENLNRTTQEIKMESVKLFSLWPSDRAGTHVATNSPIEGKCHDR